MFQSPGQILVQIGPLAFRWYGFLIGIGILLAIVYGVKELRRRGLNPDHLYDMGFWLVLAGVVGARIYYVIFQWGYYGKHLNEILMIWKGGLAIHGALIGGFLAFFTYTQMKKINWLMYADIIIPGVAIAQALGRWGNFFNNEAFGGPTSLPWKLFIPESFRPVDLKQFEYFHPTFLYESLWNIFIFVILIFLSRKLYGKQKEARPGFILFTYLIFYSIGRYFIEGLRIDSLLVGQFRTAQLVSLILFIVGMVGFIWLKNTKKPEKS